MRQTELAPAKYTEVKLNSAGCTVWHRAGVESCGNCSPLPFTNLQASSSVPLHQVGLTYVCCTRNSSSTRVKVTDQCLFTHHYSAGPSASSAV